MSLLDRLAHARVLDRIGPPLSVRAEPRPEPRRAPAPADAAFERHERDLALEPEPAGVRGFGRSRSGLRSNLLGGCLDRLRLPGAPALGRDLVCLGAQGAGRAVFIDTETTGLGGVSVPFVVGIAWIEDRRLRTVQWTLARCSGEAELLADVLARLEAIGPAPLVSFNGASFDLPLLRLRAHRYGLSARVFDAEHVDLLHPARRLNRGRGRDCKLGTLERELLGVHRRGDIDSAEIPEVFWTWVQSPNDERAQRRLRAVCDHNLADLATLPALAAWLGEAIREPGDLDRALRAARHLDRVGASEQARLVLTRWVGAGAAGPSSGLHSGLHSGQRGRAWREAALELATFERRAGERERAAALWRAAWLTDPGCPEASEAWAKHLEHQVGDFAQALRVARGSRDPCERRIARLEARLTRAVERRAANAGPPSPPSPPSTPSTPSTPSLRSPELESARPEAVVVNLSPVRSLDPPPALSRPTIAPERARDLLVRIDETDAGAVVRYRLLR